MEGEADLEGLTKNGERELREVGLEEGSSWTGSPGNVGKMEVEVEVRFEERGDRGGKMD